MLVLLFILLVLAILVVATKKELEKEYSAIPEKTTSIFQSEGNKKLEKRIDICKKSLLAFKIVIPALFVVSVLVGSIYTLNEQHSQAVVETLGKPDIVEGAGIHFKPPFISKVNKIDTTVKEMVIGYTTDKNGKSVFVEDESLMITKDFNFINVDFYLEYMIVDGMNYLFGSASPEEILKNVAQSAIRNTIGMHDVDDVLTVGKEQIQSEIQNVIKNELAEKSTGLEFLRISMQDAEPPTKKIQKAFKAVETAKQNAETALNNANKYSATKIPDAEAQADKYRKNAEAKKTERINEAKSEVAIFNAMYDEYVKNPDSVKLRLYYENMEELLPNLKVIINSTDDDISNIFINGSNVAAQSEVNQ